MEISGSRERSWQVFARGIDLYWLSNTACHLLRRLTLLVTSDIRRAAILLDLSLLWTQRKLIYAIFILSSSTRTVTGTPVMDATSSFFSFLTPTSHSGRYPGGVKAHLRKPRE